MFDIEKLKQLKLVELQDIAKKIGLKKTSQVKKMDLIYMILDEQAAVIGDELPFPEESAKEEKPKAKTRKPRKRVVKETPKKEAVSAKTEKVEKEEVTTIKKVAQNKEEEKKIGQIHKRA